MTDTRPRIQWRGETLRRVAVELIRLRDGWLGNGEGKAITREAFESFEALCYALPEFARETITVFPTEEGGLRLETHGQPWIFVDVMPDGPMEWLTDSSDAHKEGMPPPEVIEAFFWPDPPMQEDTLP